MLFSFAALAAFAAVASANTVEFVNQDSTNRIIYFTASEGFPAIENVVLGGHLNATVEFPYGWKGNWFTNPEGEPCKPGMLGEVTWNAFAGANYFDVSAIVDPNDWNNVKMLFPKLSLLPLSGCQTFPCDNAYNLPDDIQTQSTPESDLVCLVGNLEGASSRKSRRHPRHFVSHGAVTV